MGDLERARDEAITAAEAAYDLALMNARVLRDNARAAAEAAYDLALAAAGEARDKARATAHDEYDKARVALRGAPRIWGEAPDPVRSARSAVKE